MPNYVSKLIMNRTPGLLDPLNQRVLNSTLTYSPPIPSESRLTEAFSSQLSVQVSKISSESDPIVCIPPQVNQDFCITQESSSSAEQDKQILDDFYE